MGDFAAIVQTGLGAETSPLRGVELFAEKRKIARGQSRPI